jgi:hypothetical protein
MGWKSMLQHLKPQTIGVSSPLAFVLEVLRKHRTRQLKMRLQAGSANVEHEVALIDVNRKLLNLSHIGTDFYTLSTSCSRLISAVG